MTSETTSETIETLVTPDMEERKGVWAEGRTSYPVSHSDIRKWAIASYWPETPPRLFWDEDYAAGTRWEGIIAPQDFNPFAWPVERPQPGGGGGGARPAPAGPRTTGMNGGQTDTYGVPMQPGDVITARSRLAGWNERQTRLGLTLFVENETEWRNQNDKLVRRRISVGIRYLT